MKYEVNGKAPAVDRSAVVAPTAVLSGDVTVGADAHISFGAVILGEEAPITIGSGSIVRENVVIRSSAKRPVQIGKSVLIGAHSALYGWHRARRGVPRHWSDCIPWSCDRDRS